MVSYLRIHLTMEAYIIDSATRHLSSITKLTLKKFHHFGSQISARILTSNFEYVVLSKNGQPINCSLGDAMGPEPAGT